MDLNQLNAFHAVVTCGSLGRASALLNVTQPALSRTIQRLEANLGAPLFERHTTGMQLTDVGRALMPHATLLLRESQLAQEEIKAMLGLARGTVRVGVVGSLAASAVLPLAIGRTCARWPKLQVFVLEGVWDQLADALVSREIDLALGVEVPDTDEVEAIPDCRWRDTCCIVSGKRHPLRKRRSLTLADLLNERWVLPPRGTPPYEQVSRLFAQHGLPMPNVAAQTRSAVALKSLVSESGFLSWMPEPMFQTERKAGLIRALAIPGAHIERNLVAFRRRVGMLPAPTIKLLDELRHLTAQDAPEDRLDCP